MNMAYAPSQYSSHNPPDDDMANPAPLTQHRHHRHPLSDDNRSNVSAIQHPSKPAPPFTNSLPHPISCEIKPRLTKEQHDVLEAHFRKQSKPNTSTKKGFAEALNVSIDKVNNWFQNRRAKSKQDAKKAGAVLDIIAQQQQQATANVTGPDSAASNGSDHVASLLPSGLPVDDGAQGQQVAQKQQHAFHTQPPSSNNAYSHCDSSRGPQSRTYSARANYLTPSGLSSSFQTTNENRRTLTQEQFDEFMQFDRLPSHRFHHLSVEYADPHAILREVFPEVPEEELHQRRSLKFSHSDLVMDATLRDQSLLLMSMNSQDRATGSISSPDWTDSRSSSVSLAPGQEFGNPLHSEPVQNEQHHQVSQAPHPDVSSAPSSGVASEVSPPGWDRSRDVAVPVSSLNRQAHGDDGRHAHQEQVQSQQASQRQPSHSSLGLDEEKPSVWPTEGMFEGRRESQSSVTLARQLDSFGLQPAQSADDVAHHPPNASPNIAARRQQPRPAALGLSSLRSQSYTPTTQPGSPGHPQNMSRDTSRQTLRHIRSNSVAQGRVSKSSQGHGQRSPLASTFADAMQSPKALMHAASLSSLVSPSTTSPSAEAIHADQALNAMPHLQLWNSASGQVSRHASISETDLEHINSFTTPASTSASTQDCTSPPQTPMHSSYQYTQQHCPQPDHRFHTITENTPPQSAPATQLSFLASDYMMGMPQQQHPHGANLVNPTSHISYLPQKLSMSESQASSLAHSHLSHYSATTGADFPSHTAFDGFAMSSQPMGGMMGSRAEDPVQYVNTSEGFAMGPPTHVQPFRVADHSLHAATDRFVSGYSSAQDPKIAEATPQNYTFANQGPEHFEKR